MVERRVARILLNLGRVLMVGGGGAIVAGDLIGWFRGPHPTTGGLEIGAFSSFYAMPKPLWVALVALPSLVLIGAPRRRWALRIASGVSCVPALPLILAFTSRLPQAFPSHYVATSRNHAGIWLSVAGAAAGAIGAAFAVNSIEDLAKLSRKRCPDCAEEVLAEARVCKHCGHTFELMGERP